jgi:hypothetical protein
MDRAKLAPFDFQAPPSATGAAGEARREPRPRTLLSGKLVFGPHDHTADCTIRNLSGGGAKIQTSLAATLPREFWLIVVKQGVAYRASIAWRRDETLGLHFEAAHDLSMESDPQMARVRQVWRQLIDR